VEKRNRKQQQMNLKDMLDRAVAAHHAGRFNEARTWYEKLLDCDPENPDALYLLGGIYYQNKNPRSAAELITRAIEIAPDRDYFYNHLGLALNAMGNTDDAMDAFRSALAVNPQNPETYNMMGKVLREKGKTTEAIDAFRRAIDLDPEYIEACHNLGGVLLKHDHPKRPYLFSNDSWIKNLIWSKPETGWAKHYYFWAGYPRLSGPLKNVLKQILKIHRLIRIWVPLLSWRESKMRQPMLFKKRYFFPGIPPKPIIVWKLPARPQKNGGGHWRV
jgi:tetratricopeptide (TPR) repeat protein